MLKDRIRLTNNGFKIYMDDSAGPRDAYYTIFNDLKDGMVNRADARNISYIVDVMNPGVTVTDKTFVCVWESIGEKVLEEHSFYINRSGSRARIKWSIVPARRYGENAYKITLEWLDPVYEIKGIHKKHMWLKNKKTGMRYSFLKETLLDGGRDCKDEYAIEVPAGMEVNVNDLIVEGDELLCSKYILVGSI